MWLPLVLSFALSAFTILQVGLPEKNIARLTNLLLVWMVGHSAEFQTSVDFRLAILLQTLFDIRLYCRQKQLINFREQKNYKINTLKVFFTGMAESAQSLVHVDF